MVKNLSAMQETRVGSLDEEDPLKKEGHGNQLQYSCLENSTDRGAWWDIVYGVAESEMTDQQTHTFHRMMTQRLGCCCC